MSIPNEEVAYIYENTIMDWFTEKVRQDDLTEMYTALLKGDGETFQKELNRMLFGCISYMDTEESFYHGFLLGVLSKMRDHLIKSNRERGMGRTDIFVYSYDVRQSPVIIEIKVAKTYDEMELRCMEGLAQIEGNRYDAEFPEEGYKKVYHCGIAFYKKQSSVRFREKVF